jgi:hypothetical protein
MAVITASVYCPECCTPTPPQECCPYNIQKFLNDEITIQDLPNSLNFFGHGTINKNDPEIYVSEDFYLVYGDPNDITFNGIQPVVGYTQNGWSTLIDFSTTNQTCLLNGGFWSDNFEDSYKAVVYSGVEINITRTSLCSWTGQVEYNSSLYSASLSLGSIFEPPINQEWVLTASISQPYQSSQALKSDIQNSPIGTYVNPASLQEFYVQNL